MAKPRERVEIREKRYVSLTKDEKIEANKKKNKKKYCIAHVFLLFAADTRTRSGESIQNHWG